MLGILEVILLSGGVIGYLAMFLGVYALIEVKAMQRSTHKIEYVPITHKDVEENNLEAKLGINKIEEELLDDTF